MTHLPPFRTRLSPPPSSDTDDLDDELPMLGEDAILERGAAPVAATPAQDAPPWETAPDASALAPARAAAAPMPAPAEAHERVTTDAPGSAQEKVAGLDPEFRVQQRLDVAQASTLAGAWAAQYEVAASRRRGQPDEDDAPPVLTDVLGDAAATWPVPASEPASDADERDERDELDERDVPVLTTRIEPDAPADTALEEIDDTDTGLSTSDEALAERIADSVMAALQPSLRDTVLDAVRDTLAAARLRG